MSIFQNEMVTEYTRNNLLTLTTEELRNNAKNSKYRDEQDYWLSLASLKNHIEHVYNEK